MKSAHEHRGYRFTIDNETEITDYEVNFADFTDIITSGASQLEAYDNAIEALDLHLESLAKLGLPVPKLSAHGRRPFGLCEGKFTVPDDFDDPLPEDILRLFEGE